MKRKRSEALPAPSKLKKVAESETFHTQEITANDLCIVISHHVTQKINYFVSGDPCPDIILLHHMCPIFWHSL